MKRRFMALCLAGSMLLMTALTGCQRAAGQADEGQENAGQENAEQTERTEMETLAVPEPVSMEDNYRTYYEVFVYSFYDGNGDGIGDLKGLTKKLDYINDGDPATMDDLGCNGIWLMPVMPSPTYHKYDTTDYYSIDPEYGTMEDFEAFLSACRERGIKVIMDLALNHTSSEHPWFQEACSYLKELGDGEPDPGECPYVLYYNFSKEKKSGFSPVKRSDIWYYEAQFWDGMPDLNLYNEELRAEIEKIADFWLAKGVGGFRLDAAKEYVTGADGSNIEILSWFNDVVKEKYPDAYLVAEVFSDMAVYEKYYESGIDSLFDFDFANKDGIIAKVVKGNTPASFYSQRLQEIEGIFSAHNKDYIDAPFYTNHDMGRSAGYYAGEGSEAQTKLAGAMNLMMSGSAFIYYGEELGMKGSGKDENKRAPMYFSSDPSAEGMCRGPSDMDDFEMKFGSYEEQKDDPSSVYQYYKKAVYYRNLYPEIRKGTVNDLPEYDSDSVAAFTKTWEELQLHVLINVSGETQTLALQGNLQEAALENGLYTGEEEADLTEGNLTIPPYGIVFLRSGMK